MKQPMTLPQDAIVDILSKLPVKTLQRFRCVEKSWNSLILDPKFIKMHLGRIMVKEVDGTSSGMGRSVLMSANPCSGWSILCDNLDDVGLGFGDIVVSVDSSKVLPGDKFEDCEVVGSCDGLLCLNVGSSFILWNPTTGVFREVNVEEHEEDGDDNGVIVEADSHEDVDGNLEMDSDDDDDDGDLTDSDEGPRYVYGFGYDSVTSDYKIVLANCCGNPGSAVEVEIFSLGSGDWRKIDDRVPGYFLYQAGVFANGALHWLEVPGGKNVIMSFNLEKEEFERVIRLPEIDITRAMITVLKVLGGKLSVLANIKKSRDSGEVELWAVDDYGVQGSWSRKVRIVSQPGPIRVFGQSFVPLCLSREGELLLVVGGVGLVMYEPIMNTYRILDVPNQWNGMWDVDQAIEYVESLVSPFTNFKC